jgi:signal transduction histidine kinase
MEQTESTALRNFLRLSPLEWGPVLLLVIGIFLESRTSELGGPTVVVILLTLPLMWRRRWPIPVFVLVALSTFITQTPYTTIAAILVAMYAVGLYSTHDLAALGLLLGLSSLIVIIYSDPAPLLPRKLFPYLVLTVAWLAARAVRQQRVVADAFQSKALHLEAEQEQATRSARAEERRRIAREIHDVIAHSVSVMVVQAGAARSVLRATPDDSVEALLAIEETGRETLGELRRLLDVLSDDNDTIDRAPQPDIGQLDPLIERVRRAGLPVRLQINGTPAPLSSVMSLTAYRIVQEALTNALKYSGQAATDVILTYTGDELKLEILDNGPAALLSGTRQADQTGHGLSGMKERTAVFGGLLEAGPRPGGGYAVRAWLPIGAAG